jgi:hypothetical protein
MVDSEMELSPGIAVLAMVLDTLSGRTPLYRLEEFFQEKDAELILGHDVEPELFCDYNVGRVLDKIFVISELKKRSLSLLKTPLTCLTSIHVGCILISPLSAFSVIMILTIRRSILPTVTKRISVRI